MFTISCPPKVVWLGREGENEFRTIEVEVSEWLREYPNGTISVVYHRPDDSIYMPTVTTSGNVTRWLITSTDTSFTGRGEAEFRIIDGDVVGKSVKMPTMVSDGINATTDDPDSAPADWTVEAGRLQNEIDDLDTRVTELEEHGGGGEGTSDHRQLTNRDAANQHPISAITGLQSALDGKQASGDYATSGELDALADIVDGKADAADIPSLAGYATEAYVQNYHDNTKQDVISDIASIRSGAAKGATAVQTSAEIEAMLAQDVELVYGGFSTEDVIDALYNGKEAPNTYAQKSDFVDIPYADLGATPYTYSEIVAGHNNGKKYRVLAPHNSDTVICPLQTIAVNAHTTLIIFGSGIASIDMSVGKFDYEVVTLHSDNSKSNYHNYAPINASGCPITDSGNYYTSTNVEGALQEIGTELSGINTLIGSGVIA